jgi:tetratricopeptide (TPR) repeat protein
LVFALGVAFSVGYSPQSSAQSTQRGAKPDFSNDSDSAIAGNGKYYALVIGIDKYEHVPQLQTAVKDAQAIAQTLSQDYGFKVQLLLDANGTRDNIINALDQYTQDLQEKDNLLVYYAGHGQKRNDDSYWWPVDARDNQISRWISAEDITRELRAQTARHVLLIADSCYSGGLTLHRGGDVNVRQWSDEQALLRKSLAGKSRSLMASGGDEPVADGGPNGHSVFANALLKGLQSENDGFTARQLFTSFVELPVTGGSAQMPQYEQIRNSNDDGYGDFVFARAKVPGVVVAQNGAVRTPTAPPLKAHDDAANAIPARTLANGNTAPPAMGASDMELYRKALLSRDPAVIEDAASKMSNQSLASVLRMRAQSLRTLSSSTGSPGAVAGSGVPAAVPSSRAKAQTTFARTEAEYDASRGNYAKALPIYKQLAESGDSESMVNLGYLYYNGWGVSQDYTEAAKWFNQAAAAGETKVMSALGLMYAMGRGVERSDQLALE